jgi:hypothetical protein
MVKQNPKTDSSGKKLKKKVNRDVAKLVNKGKFNRYLMALNPYFLTLVDPFSVHGVKIPDLQNFPSTTFSIVDRRTVIAGAAGGVGGIVYGVVGWSSRVAVGALVPVPYTSGLLDYSVGMTLGSGSGTANLFPSGGAGVQPTPFTFSQWAPPANGAPALFSKARLVSAGLVIEAVGAPLNAKGKFTLASAPRNYLRGILDTTAVSVDRIAQIPDAIVVPINKLTGGSVCYRPLDGKSLEYTQIRDIVYPDNTASAQLSWEHAMGGELYVIIDGATVNDTFQVTAVFNYEAIPVWNQMNLIAGTSSPSDPIALSMAMNKVQLYEPTTDSAEHARPVVKGETALVSPPVTNGSHMTATDQAGVGQEPSLFEKLANGAEEIIERGSSLLTKASPLIKAAMAVI